MPQLPFSQVLSDLQIQLQPPIIHQNCEAVHTMHYSVFYLRWYSRKLALAAFQAVAAVALYQRADLSIGPPTHSLTRKALLIDYSCGAETL